MHAGTEAGGHAHATGSAADLHGDASARAERGPLLAEGSGAPTGAHAHCGLLPARDPRQRAPESVRVEPAPLLFGAVELGGPRAAHASVPLLLRAPKQSPPA